MAVNADVNLLKKHYYKNPLYDVVKLLDETETYNLHKMLGEFGTSEKRRKEEEKIKKHLQKLELKNRGRRGNL